MSKHTPGPWRVTKEYLEYCKKSTFNSAPEAIVGPKGEVVVASSEWLDLSPEDARLIAAAPDLLSAQTMGANMNTPDFLDWLAERLVHVYGESSNVDFVLSLKARAAAGRAAIAKATGEQP